MRTNERYPLNNYLESVYIIPVFEKWLFYAPFHGITALVNSRTIEIIRDKKQCSQSEIQNLIKLLEQRPKISPRQPEGLLQPEFLGIIPTRSCNLQCVYCDFECPPSEERRMDYTLAVSAVDWMTEYSYTKKLNTLNIHFFGGEPFCAPDVVDVAVHRARMNASKLGMTTYFEADTNGYFDEKRCQFVGDYIDSVILSLDGPQEIHDKQRPTKSGEGSFSRIAQNARYLGRTKTKLCLRVCVTQGNVTLLGDISNYFINAFHPSIVNYEPLKPSPLSDAAGLTTPDPWEFARHFLNAHIQLQRHGIEAVYSAASLDVCKHSLCPLGNDTIIISPDGKVNSCYLLEKDWKKKNLNLTMGQLSSTGELILQQDAVETIRNMAFEKKRCQRCIAKWHCAGGCHVMNYPANQKDAYDTYCIQTRIIVTGLLLRRLGLEHEVHRLLADQEELEIMAFHSSDRVLDVHELSAKV